MKKAAILLALGIYLLATTRWLTGEEWLTVMSASDIISYVHIATAAPHFPGKPVLFHHGQRFLIPYLIGLATYYSGLPYDKVFILATILFCALIVLVIHKILTRFGLSLAAYTLCVSMLILQPGVIRYYLVVPGMVIDLAFTFGVALTILALLNRSLLQVLGAIVFCALTRQTSLLLLPGVALWILLAPGWRERPLKYRILSITAVAVLLVATSIVTAMIASTFSYSSKTRMIWTLTGTLLWLQGSPSLLQYVRFVSWGVMPLSFPLFVLAGLYFGGGIRPRGVESWSCALIAATIFAQPLLSGPDINNNIIRHAAHAFIPLLIILGMTLRDSDMFRRIPTLAFWLMQAAIIAGSIHHEYTFIAGDFHLFRLFSLIYYGLALLTGIVTFVLARSAKKTSPPGLSLVGSRA